MKRRVHYRRNHDPNELYYMRKILNYRLDRAIPMIEGKPDDMQIAILIKEGVIEIYDLIYDHAPILARKMLIARGWRAIPAPEFGVGATTLKPKANFSAEEWKGKRRRTKKTAGMYVKVAAEERKIISEQTGEQLPMLFLLEQAQ